MIPIKSVNSKANAQLVNYKAPNPNEAQVPTKLANKGYIGASDQTIDYSSIALQPITLTNPITRRLVRGDSDHKIQNAQIDSLLRKHDYHANV